MITNPNTTMTDDTDEAIAIGKPEVRKRSSPEASLTTTSQLQAQIEILE